MFRNAFILLWFLSYMTSQRRKAQTNWQASEKLILFYSNQYPKISKREPSIKELQKNLKMFILLKEDKSKIIYKTVINHRNSLYQIIENHIYIHQRLSLEYNLWPNRLEIEVALALCLICVGGVKKSPQSYPSSFT